MRLNVTFHFSDIGLIKLTSPIEYTLLIQPITMACSSANRKSYVIAIGNGNTKDPNEKVAPILQYTFKMRVLSMFKCWHEFPFLLFRASVICASGVEQTSTCPGDSGGPLIAADTETLVGITSFVNDEGCQKGLPQGFTRVSAHLKWIKKVTGISCENHMDIDEEETML